MANNQLSLIKKRGKTYFPIFNHGLSPIFNCNFKTIHLVLVQVASMCTCSYNMACTCASFGLTWQHNQNNQQINKKDRRAHRSVQILFSSSSSCSLFPTLPLPRSLPPAAMAASLSLPWSYISGRGPTTRTNPLASHWSLSILPRQIQARRLAGQ